MQRRTQCSINWKVGQILLRIMAVPSVVIVIVVVIVVVFLMIPALISERRREGKKPQMSQTDNQPGTILSGGKYNWCYIKIVLTSSIRQTAQASSFTTRRPWGATVIWSTTSVFQGRRRSADLYPRLGNGNSDLKLALEGFLLVDLRSWNTRIAIFLNNGYRISTCIYK